MRKITVITAFVIGLLSANIAVAQGTPVSFGTTGHNPADPIEISSDTLRIDDNDGSAVFEGNVLVGQGDMRLTAPKVTVSYDTETSGEIKTVTATGGVTFVTPTEAAEGQKATYAVDTGLMVMTGDVLLTQDRSVMSGDRLIVDVDRGTGMVQGRVKTILQSGNQ
jgi:lipopolysaccharide export system protein LptA